MLSNMNIKDNFEAIKDDVSFTPFYENESYTWLKHNKLGWVYESIRYDCYSIRNESHASGEEALFPFEQYQEMIEMIRNHG